MINDITNEIYTVVKNAMPEITVLQDYPDTTPIFPCVIVSDIGYTTDTETVDSDGEYANFGGINFAIFSNNKNRRTECKGIRNRIDEIITSYKMERAIDQEVPNFADTTVYQRILGYTFKIDKNGTIYRR